MAEEIEIFLIAFAIKVLVSAFNPSAFRDTIAGQWIFNRWVYTVFWYAAVFENLESTLAGRADRWILCAVDSHAFRELYTSSFFVVPNVAWSNSRAVARDLIALENLVFRGTAGEETVSKLINVFVAGALAVGEVLAEGVIGQFYQDTFGIRLGQDRTLGAVWVDTLAASPKCRENLVSIFTEDCSFLNEAKVIRVDTASSLAVSFSAETAWGEIVAFFAFSATKVQEILTVWLTNHFSVLEVPD